MNLGNRKKNAREYNEWSTNEAKDMKIPWRGIVMAIFLSITGLWLLCLGILSALGYLDQKYEDRILTFLMLGGLMFIPGAYHVFIAFCAYTRKHGYSYEDIPDLD